MSIPCYRPWGCMSCSDSSCPTKEPIDTDDELSYDEETNEEEED